MSQGVPVETWRKILQLKAGKYSTFELDNEFNIMSREDEVRPSVGDYFRIPFVSDPLQLDYRISISHRRISPILTGRNGILTSGPVLKGRGQRFLSFRGAQNQRRGGKSITYNSPVFR